MGTAAAATRTRGMVLTQVQVHSLTALGCTPSVRGPIGTGLKLEVRTQG